MAVLTATSFYTDRLSDVELLGLANAINFGMDVTEVDGYDKVKVLFKYGIHADTKAAINKLALERSGNE